MTNNNDNGNDNRNENMEDTAITRRQIEIDEHSSTEEATTMMELSTENDKQTKDSSNNESKHEKSILGWFVKIPFSFFHFQYIRVWSEFFAFLNYKKKFKRRMNAKNFSF